MVTTTAATSDLHENWNRYYDPGIGRYLQPEPLLSPQQGLSSVTEANELQRPGRSSVHGGPDFIAWSAKRGMSTPAYAYAANNPIGFYDSDGKDVRLLFFAVGVGVVFVGWHTAWERCVEQCKKDSANSSCETEDRERRCKNACFNKPWWTPGTEAPPAPTITPPTRPSPELEIPE